ncbi:MAG: tetratricopeptide repeat protein, partial [Planctomycetota bacterium]|nr:tetratricopeptide repeat protein [Planctomycetota bacterium]
MRLKGLDLEERREYEQALACYQDAVAADPSFAPAYNEMGMVLIDLERYEEAVAALQTAIRLDPLYADPHNNLGFVLRRLSRHTEAAEVYARYLELNPDDTDAPRIRKWLASLPTSTPEAPAPA